MGAAAEWFSPDGLATWLEVPVSTVYEWRYKRVGPPGVKIGRHVRFRRSDVERWLAERAEQDRSRAGAH